MHHHDHPVGAAAPGPWALIVVAMAIGALLIYVAASVRLRVRGNRWPWARDCAWALGCATVAAAAVLPAQPMFTAHMWAHLLVGMVAPLFLVVARPVTLALRALRPGPARRTVLALAHSRYAAVVVAPPVAAVIDMGGLWLIYRTPLFAAMHEHSWLNVAVHLHVFAAGMLFTTSILQLEPVRRRYGLLLRGLILFVAGAAHAVLAKTLYEWPPPGVFIEAGDRHTASQVMYYGGDLAELALAAMLGYGWYCREGRLRAREHRRLDISLSKGRSSAGVQSYGSGREQLREPGRFADTDAIVRRRRRAGP
ncbi:cytochrome c oxidase assembly protein [Williamsia muralis]|uniref:cytochrome c oxidase assembly protein n=1 Tax=Williamsia marianensis TaxID=85044 RepID=UPI003F13F70C